MTDIAALRAYLESSFPDDLAAGDDGAVYAAMRAEGGTATRTVSPGKFAVWAAAGPRASIEDHATDAQSPLRASALSLRDFLAGSMPYLDLSEPGVQALLAAWVASGAITQQQSDDLYALAQAPVSVAERDGFPNATLQDIIDARSLPA